MAEITIPKIKNNRKHAWHIYTIQLNLEKLNADRDAVFSALIAENIGVNVLYIPLYRHPFYRGYENLPNAEYVYERILTLPLFPKMTDEDAEDVINAVNKVVGHYRK